MKLVKFAAICAAAVSVSAFAEDYSNEIALLKANNANNLHTVLVGINFSNADGSAVSVSNAVKTAGLPEGTLLYAYDKANEKYYIYSIANNAWTSNTKYYVNSEGNLTEEQTVAANAMTLPVGSAAFLAIPTNVTASSVNVITAGKPIESYSASLSSGANLCCFPVGKAVNLNQSNASAVDYAAPLKANPTATVFVENSNKTAISTVGDTIVMPRSDTGASRIFYYDGSNWGYIGKVNGAKTFITNDAIIPGGLGFWYNNVAN